jgi:hypothetical protein
LAENHHPAPSPREAGYHDEFGWVSGSCGSERPETVDALSRRFPGWTISFEPVLQFYSAEKAEGTKTRVLVAYRPSELAIKIAAAEAAGS